MKHLSVGIPAYNQGKFLKRTINSLLNQSVAPFEIVVSDNHSTDETSQVLKELGDRIKVIRPQEHLSMIAHWNFVVSNLSSDCFSLLSSDDVALPNFVSVMLRGLNHPSSPILVRSGFETIDEDDRVLKKNYILSVNKITYPPKTFYEQLGGPKVSFAAFALKKSAWEQVGGFPEKYYLAGDWGMWLRISPLGSFVYEHEIVSQYRIRKSNAVTINRIQNTLSDFVTTYHLVIPEISKRFETIDSETIKGTSKKVFINQIYHASNILSKEDRLEAYQTLLPWAVSTECESDLEKFKDGYIFKTSNATGNFVAFIRSVVQFLRSL